MADPVLIDEERKFPHGTKGTMDRTAPRAKKTLMNTLLPESFGTGFEAGGAAETGAGVGGLTGTTVTGLGGGGTTAAGFFCESGVCDGGLSLLSSANDYPGAGCREPFFSLRFPQTRALHS